MKSNLALATGLALFWLLGATVFHHNLEIPLRFYSDDFDRGLYAERGSWALHGTVPYRDVFSEYPQVPTYLFGLPYLVVQGRDAHMAVFSLLMIVCLGATILWLKRERADRPSLAYLMLLPAALYFSFNRFDLLTSFLVLVSLRLLARKRSIATGVCLATATLTKWYPVLLLPLYLSYEYRRDRRVDWALLLAFGAAAAIIVLPVLIAGGLKPVLSPYAFHAGRGLEMASLPALLDRYVHNSIGLTLAPRLIQAACLALVGVAVVLGSLARLDTIDRVANWAVVIVGSCVLLSTIWSPQWILWVLPLMIVTARAGDVPWLVAYGVLDYLAFPVFYDGIGHESASVQVASLLVYAVIARGLVVAYRRAANSSALSAAPAP